MAIGKYLNNYLLLAVKGSISTLLWIGAHFLLLSIYNTYNADNITIKTFIQFTLVPRWTSADKSGHKAIKFTFFKYHHHHVVLVARISLTLSRHFSLSFIASGRSSGQHPVSSHSCWMYVRAGRPAFARPCVGVHKSTSLMSSSLLLQQCPACLVRLTWIVFVIGGRWPYTLCLVWCCPFEQLYCSDFFFIWIESLSVNVGKYMRPSKKDQMAHLYVLTQPLHNKQDVTQGQFFKWSTAGSN